MHRIGFHKKRNQKGRITKGHSLARIRIPEMSVTRRFCFGPAAYLAAKFNFGGFPSAGLAETSLATNFPAFVMATTPDSASHPSTRGKRVRISRTVAVFIHCEPFHDSRLDASSDFQGKGTSSFMLPPGESSKKSPIPLRDRQVDDGKIPRNGRRAPTATPNAERALRSHSVG